MRPLLFLAGRSLANAVRRTFRSPWRLIPLLFLVGWQGYAFGRFVFRPGQVAPPVDVTPPEIQLPGDELVGILVFGAMLAVVLLNSVGLGAFRATFRASDADVLFPTPVPSTSVIAWRAVTDSLLRLIFPLVLGVFALARGREGWQYFASSMPDAAGFPVVAQLAVLMYLLVTLSFSVWGWGLSLWLYRPTLGPNRGPFVAALVSVVYAAAPVALFAGGAMRGEPLETLARMSADPVIGILYFPAKCAAMVAASPLVGGTTAAVVGSLGIAAFLAGGTWLTAKNSPYLYEQSSLRAYQASATIESARTKGAGYSAVLAKASRSRGARRGYAWASRWRAEGPSALLWKEAVITARSGLAQVAVATILVCAGVVAITRMPESGPVVLVLVFAVAFAPFVCSPTTRAIVLPEALMRLDLVKPLPLTSWHLLATDALSRTLVPLVATAVPTLMAVALRPSDSPLLVAAWLGGNACAFLFVTAMLPAAIAFPDARDPAQATIRGLVSACVALLGLAVLATPALVLAAFHLPAWPGLLFSAAVLVGCGLLASSLAGKMYDTFNPADP